MKMTLDPNDTLLMVIDVQERLLSSMIPERFGRLMDNLKRLAGAREHIGYDLMITEQYPKGLGPTSEQVLSYFGADTPRLEKITFSCAKDEGIRQVLEASGKKTLLITGIETHVCVYQTVRDLAGEYNIHVLSDAVCSRHEPNYQVGLSLMKDAGAVITGTETVLFDLMERAGTDRFRAVSKLVR